LIKAKDGSNVVAIIGGFYGKGMEIWNPKTREVELLWDVIPPEEGGLHGLYHAEILPVNDGSDFILYGGFEGTYKDDIWKYNVETNSWTKYCHYFI